MIDLQSYLENKVRNIISSWEENGIYAISFFIHSEEFYECDGFCNLTEFSVGYNTENDCIGAGELSEERWNYAFWRQNETPIIEISEDNEGLKLLLDWYKEKGINNVGYEDYSSCYDSKMVYIGKGPVGYYELLLEIAAVAAKLQDSGFVKEKFGVPIPIIIHDYEYPWYIIEANKKANPNGEADMFLTAINGLMH